MVIATKKVIIGFGKPGLEERAIFRKVIILAEIIATVLYLSSETVRQDFQDLQQVTAAISR